MKSKIIIKPFDASNLIAYGGSQGGANVVEVEKEVCITEDSAFFAYPEQWEKSWKWDKDFLTR